MADLNPKPQDVAGKEPELRAAFKKKYEDNIKKGLYDQKDLDRFEKEDAYTRCFLRTMKAKGSVEKAVDTVHESFKFRKEIGLSGVSESSFPADLVAKKAICYKGADINGHPILYFNVKENNYTATPEQSEKLRQYIAWNFEQHQSKNPEQMCVVLMDMSGASTSNLNIDITKFIIACFTTYFPTFLAYMINYEMPLLVSATWTVISAFLSADQKQKLLMVKKKDIGKYIPPEHLWDHMK
jgi:hypothetical protein